MSPVAKPYPKEFRDDVVRVAQSREPGVTIAQVAKDFGIHPGTLENWMRQERVEAGEQGGEQGGARAARDQRWPRRHLLLLVPPRRQGALLPRRRRARGAGAHRAGALNHGK